MAIPVTLITGFLGSGKTSLINRILAERSEMKISVVLNEFGDTKLESQFIKGHKGDIFELSNGCMCCVAQDDFVRVVKWILEEKPETEHVLIEASGASDPLPVISTFRESEISDKIVLTTVVCVVDGVNFFTAKEKYRTVMVQLSNSDMAWVSKVEEAGEDQVKKVEEFIGGFIPRMWVGRIEEGMGVDLILDASGGENSTLKGTGKFKILNSKQIINNNREQIQNSKQITNNNKQNSGEHNEHSHVGDGIDSLVWRSEEVLDFERVNSLLKGLPASVIRVKGVLNLLVDGVMKKFLLQYVGERSEVQEGEWNEGEKPHTEVVCVGKGFDAVGLREKLEECVLGNK